MKEKHLTKLHYRILTDLLTDIDDGQIHRCRLERGLALAYAENKHGLLTLSRVAPQWPSDDEIETIKKAFREVCEFIGTPVLNIQYMHNEVITGKTANHHCVRLAVYFGSQPSLF